jgi:hypothetical protein
MGWLVEFSGQGTSFNVPLGRAMTFLKANKWKGADILLITDGIGNLDFGTVRRFEKFKKLTRTRMLMLAIGSDLKQVLSDSSEAVPDEVRAIVSLCDGVIYVDDILNGNDEAVAAEISKFLRASSSPNRK